MNDNIILKMSGITKAFPGVKALDNVSFELRRGELHALCGENGAGKSTLMKILGGIYTPDQGEVNINNKVVHIKSPQDSMDNKIRIIYQEFNLVPHLTITENLFLGRELTKGIRLNKRQMLNEAKEVMVKLGLADIDCRKKVADISVATQQLVEIGKAIFNDADILVMDEPTSVLTEKETKALFALINQLIRKGISIIYISHRLEEIIQLSDRITILRDGRYIDTLDNSDRKVTKDDIVKLMVGRDLEDYFPEKKNLIQDEHVLEVDNLCKNGMFSDISFHVSKGEILGFAGLVGAGRTEIMKAVFGSLKPDNGEIHINGRKVRINSPEDAIENGLALVPEDRKREGLILGMTLGENICMANMSLISRLGCIIKGRKKETVNKFVNELQIRPALPNRLARNFSGGNQQKSVIAKWLAVSPKVVILDEPTRGIDVGAKSEIYSIIENLAQKGVGIIFISSEMLELLGVCDRVIVIHQGRITGEFKKDEFSEEKIMMAASCM